MTLDERRLVVRDYMRRMGQPAMPHPSLLHLSPKDLASQLGQLSAELVAQLHREPDLVSAIDVLRRIEYFVYVAEQLLGMAEASDKTFDVLHKSKLAYLSSTRAALIEVLRQTYPRYQLLFR